MQYACLYIWCFTGLSMPNKVTLSDTGTSEIFQPQNFVWNENGTALARAEDDQVTLTLLQLPPGLDGLLISYVPNRFA